ncbi:MarR family winged helix-turn-helix transcriptional regulator [Nocardioides jejuensis]|uniref:MarR family transcriptional regulator n=1 Tax=Nocardioides jejuensis TaxID=2502782 RepID=A0A4R1BVT7_9ACTN|nr:MarR family transcriptional regulator [Nocardioides jejuensis]TCJ21355.1 MarR family transcriptional regulator [Nocardioides jejuensis]
MTPTPDAPAELSAVLRIAVARLARRLRSERDPELDLGVGALSVLGLLHRDGPQTVGSLAESERVKPPSMTRTVGCLVDRGLVERARSAEDGRQVVVGLSEEGLATVEAQRTRRNAWLSVQLADLTAAERDVLREAAVLLRRLADA